MEHIRKLMKAGDVKGASAELEKLLAAEPDNVEAKMLYGTCRHLLGDDKTFIEIHDALAPQMDAEKSEKVKSLWRKYHALWISLITVGALVIGLGAAAVYFGISAKNQMYVAGDAMVGDGRPRMAASLYGGPRMMELERERAGLRGVAMVGDGRPRMAGTLYGGPRMMELERERAGLRWDGREFVPETNEMDHTNQTESAEAAADGEMR